MDIVAATRSYERWMASRVTVVRADLFRKHQRMAENPFILLRATFYRWMQMWPNICASLTDAPIVPGIGDLHLENFGTWRDAEGRLVWGVNDIDETCALPYTNDLVRLATSAVLATRHGHLTVTNRAICDAILDGYATSMNRGGRPLVLAEQRRWLREIAISKLRDPFVYWPKLETLPRDRGPIPEVVFRAALPAPRLPYRALRRTAGVGSLGRRRIVALAEWRGALIAREAKAWLPSAAVWATGRNTIALDADTVLRRAVRAPDPFPTVSRSMDCPPACARLLADRAAGLARNTG